MNYPLDYTARQLLSTLWMRPDLIPVAAQELQRDNLLEPTPAYWWQVMRAHIANGKLDVPSALADLDRHPRVMEYFGLAQQENYYPEKYDHAQVSRWARELADAGLRRIGAGEAQRLQAAINDLSIPLDDVIADAVTTFSALRGGSGSTWRNMEEIAQGVRAIRAAWARGENLGAVDTGFYTLDRVLGGFKNGEVSLIAARPSQGKTALACSVIVNIARRYQKQGRGECVAVFSAETSGELLQLRMAYALAGVDQTASRNGETSDEEEARVDAALTLLESLPIYIDESPAPTTDNMLVRTLMLDSVMVKGQRQRVGIGFFDFVELAGDNGGESEEQRISQIARGLKVIAKTLDCPIVPLSQLNRSADGRMPELKDLRYSGMLEQIAYAVAFIHRPAYYLKRSDPHYNPHANSEHKLAILMVAKNKDGKTGPVQLEFDEEYARFRDPHDPYADYEDGYNGF